MNAGLGSVVLHCVSPPPTVRRSEDPAEPKPVASDIVRMKLLPAARSSVVVNIPFASLGIDKLRGVPPGYRSRG